MRTQRSNGSTSTTYNYTYNGSQLTHMTYGSNSLHFYYDASGKPLSVVYNGTTYYYILSLQGDVVAILNSSGVSVVEYTYDAWGRLLTTTGTMATTLGAHNPLLYRSYVYDRETGLYYLQSRYYNPTIGRFISADSLVSTGQGVLGYNMFAYCRNNPVIIKDPNGHLGTIAVVGIVVSGFIGGIAAALNAMASGKEGWEVAANAVIGAGVGAATAAVAAVAAVAMATGAVTATAGAVAVTAGSAGIGFVGDGLSQLTDYAFHKNDPDYNYDWRASVTSLAYSTVINASSGLLSLGINISFADKADEIAGLFVAGKASTILGAIDFGIRQAINAIIELF